MPRRQPKKITASNGDGNELCLFCNKGSDEENLAVGPIYSKDNIHAHKNCLYFGATLVQTNENIDAESEGADELFFFTIDSIKKEARRSTKLKCSFCKLPNASAGCNNKKCKKKFHFPCGMANQVMFNFSEFTSLCADHQPRQNPPDKATDSICHICQDEVNPVVCFEQIYCPVCKRWLHRNCVQIWAYKAGVHHLRCPMCNNADEFKAELSRLGFELPDRDAEWEREGQFREQETGVILKCCAEKCLCPRGIEYSAKKGPQEIVACIVCGEAGIHRACNDSLNSPIPWECNICERVSLKVEAQRAVEAMYMELVAARKKSDKLNVKKADIHDHISISESEPELERPLQPKKPPGKKVSTSQPFKSSPHTEVATTSRWQDEAPTVKKIRTETSSTPSVCSSVSKQPRLLKQPSNGQDVADKGKTDEHRICGSIAATTEGQNKKSKLQSPFISMKSPSESMKQLDTNIKSSPSQKQANGRRIPATCDRSTRVFPLFEKVTSPKLGCEGASAKSVSSAGKAQGDSSSHISPLPIAVIVNTILVD